jgi:hypothetical protein
MVDQSGAAPQSRGEGFSTGLGSCTRALGSVSWVFGNGQSGELDCLGGCTCVELVGQFRFNRLHFWSFDGQ